MKKLIFYVLNAILLLILLNRRNQPHVIIRVNIKVWLNRGDIDPILGLEPHVDGVLFLCRFKLI